MLAFSWEWNNMNLGSRDAAEQRPYTCPNEN
ncbi:hypothetical protein FHS70_003468 [Flammeovirga yaeyamensis]|nr:hypothetical protein [Flammeovirga yaeyamensis]